MSKRRRCRRRWREEQEDQGQTDSVFESLNPHRLRRNPRRGRILGVCAGIADYFGVRVRLVRVAFILGVIFFHWVVIPAYLVLAFVLPRYTGPQVGMAEPGPDAAPPEAREDEEFWRGVAIKPSDTFSALRYRFRELEQRLAGLEAEVTHPDYDLKRQFKDLS